MSVPVHNEFKKNQGFMDNTLTLKDVQIVTDAAAMHHDHDDNFKAKIHEELH